MKKQSVAISGASGWLGRQLMAIYSSNPNFKQENFIAITSKRQKIQIGNKVVTTTNFQANEKYSTIDVYYDFGFLTREKISEIGPEKYFEANIQIIENSLSFISKWKPKKVVLSSSGAIYSPLENNQNDLYGSLKRIQELRTQEVCDKLGIDLIIPRIFNLSGVGIYKINTFAISNIINSALLGSEIIITSNAPVVRRYCDINEFLTLLISLTNKNYTGIFDTGGEKIEIQELTSLVVKKVKSKSLITYPTIDASLKSDEYFSTSTEYENLLDKNVGKAPLPIESQIEITAKYIKENFIS
jgi:nucleoside-diphosphate-sugar epimerase